MNLFSRKPSQKLTASERERAQRLYRQMSATTQNTINYTSLYEKGLMHVTGDCYSMTYQLGDVSYVTAQHEERLDIVETYANVFNSVGADTTIQLLVLNRKIQSDVLENILYTPEGDKHDIYRQELNAIFNERFQASTHNFETLKYLTISQPAIDREQAYIQLQDLGTTITNEFQNIDVTCQELDGLERLKIFAMLLRNQSVLTYNYQDIINSGLTSKSFIAPNRIKIFENYMQIDEEFAKVMYIRPDQYPTFMSDRLIRSLTTLGIEMAITVQGSPYEDTEALQRINNTSAAVRKDKLKSQRLAANQGVDGQLLTSLSTNATEQATDQWREEITDNDQKAFSGLIAVFFKADSKEQLAQFEHKIQASVRKLQTEFSDVYAYQEEGLNTILPIGVTFLDIRQRFKRDMTTANLATQIPFTNVDLHSKSPNALYYGQNQLSKNIITLDRKRDLNTGSGMVLGSSGSGKGMSVKGMEVIPSRLKNPNERVLVVDPEDEYSGICEEFDGQVIDISIGSNTYINLLDLPDKSKLNSEDQEDLIGHKSNLLMSIFETILGEVTDEQFTIIDRVTRAVYSRYDKPTLREWHRILKEQPEAEAENLALKSEIYAIGSQNIFAHQTNVNLDSNFITFNLKKLTGKLKPFALLVLQDYIWNQVVDSQGKQTIRLYWDEMQLQFRYKEQAIFFTELWSRIRKYGAIATGITQNPETLTSSEEGRKLLSNSEFFILLKMKKTDIKALREIISLTDEQARTLQRADKGTGLIFAEGTVVPFENPIPSHTKLYQLIQTDSYA
ncbi:TPA: AAA family ATPase [Streptococcus suis]|nr:AAA family ATPase [Streptococcus suis]